MVACLTVNQVLCTGNWQKRNRVACLAVSWTQTEQTGFDEDDVEWSAESDEKPNEYSE